MIFLTWSGFFITCTGAHFPAVELDNALFSTLSRMSGFLWHSSKWACQFGRFLQYTPGLEKLACSLNTDLNYMTTMHRTVPFLEPVSKVAAAFRGKMQKPFGWILINKYVTPAVLSPEPKTHCWIFQQNKWIKIPSWVCCAFGLVIVVIFVIISLMMLMMMNCFLWYGWPTKGI